MGQEAFRSESTTREVEQGPQCRASLSKIRIGRELEEDARNNARFQPKREPQKQPRGVGIGSLAAELKLQKPR